MSTLSALVNRPLALELGWRGALRNYARLASVVLGPFVLVGISVGLYALLRDDSAGVLATLTTLNAAVIGVTAVVLTRFVREARQRRWERPESRADADLDMALVEAVERLVKEDADLDPEQLHALERAVLREHTAMQVLAAERVRDLVEENLRLRVDTPLIKVTDIDTRTLLVPTFGTSPLSSGALRFLYRVEEEVQRAAEAAQEAARKAELAEQAARHETQTGR